MPEPTLQDLLDAAGVRLDRKGELWRTLGLRDPTKADAMAARVAVHDMRGIVHHRTGLAAALGVPRDRIDAAIDASRRRARALETAELIRAFRPHAVVETATRRPRQITIAALTGADRRRILPLPLDVAPLRWPRYVMDRMPALVPGWGRPRGFVIAYRPDRSVRFDLAGRPVAVLPDGLRLTGRSAGPAALL